jgi:nitrous oxidase accessory protein
MNAGLLLMLLLNMQGRTIVVTPGATVAAALRQAADGDTILVRAGTYPESHLEITRRIALLGEGMPVLDGGGNAVLLIRADGVTVQGFTIRNVATSFTDDRAAIRISGVSGCTIRGNVIHDAFFAIYATRSNGCVIAGNHVIGSGRSETGNANAIHLYNTRGFVVERNDVRGHRDGIYLEFGRQAVIRDNVSQANSRYGLHFMYSDSCEYRDNVFRANRAGVAVMYSRNVAMAGNTFADAAGPAAYGLLLKEIRDSRLERSHFTGNTVALSVEGGGRLFARSNRFEGNGWAVRLSGDADDGRFEGNQFAGNGFDVVTNSRQNSTRFAGNFWDRYQGYDLDHDGIGDVPFRPVRLFGLIVAQHPQAVILLNSLLVTLLDTAERVAPVLTPELPVDTVPLMRWRS